ncbi:hypothetical protein [Micromonospora sp. DT47]|uniref:hypothetical protein n=1 Tax=Micromonospora sp. DT47 TaxID=3393431 RepID=UPI003CEC145D
MSLTGAPITGSVQLATTGDAAGRPRRPIPVVTAVALLGVVVLGIAAYVAVQLEDADRLARDVAEAEARYPHLTDNGSGGLYWHVTYLFVAALVTGAGVLVVLAALTWRGYGWAHVLAALAAFVSATGGAVVLGPSALIISADRVEHGIDTSSFGSALSGLHSLSRPDWVLPLLAADAVVLPLAALAALVCLVLPASTTFYRQSRAARPGQR